MAVPTNSFDTIEITEIDDDIALVTLNRPERLNAMTSTMIGELDQVVNAVDLDPALRSVIVTGAGRGFSAGLDLQDQGAAPGSEGVGRSAACDRSKNRCLFES